MTESLGNRLKNALHLGTESPTAVDDANTGQLRRGPDDGVSRETANPVGLGTDKSAGQTGMLSQGGTSSQNATRATAGTGIPVTAVSSDAGAPSDRSGLMSSDAHWEKAMAATEEARRQAKLVEQLARSHAESSEEYYRSEREYTQAKHTVEEIETRIRGVNLDGKKSELARAKQAYEAERARIASLEQGADAARANAEQVQGDADAKGHELELQAKESKLHSDRLAGIEAALAEARAAAAEAKARAAEHKNAMEAARLKSDHHRVERDRVSGLLAKLKSELDGHRRRESEASRTLESYRGEHEGLSAEIAALEADRQRKAQELESHRSALDGLLAQRGDLQSLLGQHRQQVSALTKDTQDTMARAQAVSDSADAKAAELQQTRDQIASTERNLDASRDALTAAAAESRQINDQARYTASEVENQAQQASRLQAELIAAKERVDTAQAKKEELWALAKQEGSAADQASDIHYVKHVAEPAGVSPADMVSKTDTTANIAGKIEYGGDRVLENQQSGTAPQVA